MLSDFIIVLLTIVFIVAGLLFLVIYSLVTKQEETTLLCPLDECATNIFNGEKVCPSSTSQVSYDPSFQVCNPRYACRGSTPYALQKGGGTSASGLCPPETECACFRFPFCPDYVSSYFTVVGASPYQDLEGTNAIVYQNTSYSNALNQDVTLAPLALPNEASFCSVPESWRERIYPQQCLLGNLYYVTQNLQQFNRERDPLACIASPPCNVGTPVFEVATRKSYCL